MPTLKRNLRGSLLLALLITFGGCDQPPEETAPAETRNTLSPEQQAEVNAQISQKLKPEQEAELLARSQAAAKMLKTELKATLTESLQSQGTLAAMRVCQSMAPAIAEKAATEHQLNIRRVSLKARNPQASPDSYEAEVLAQWLADLAKDPGAPRPEFAQAVVTAITSTDGLQTGSETHFRYMEPLYIEKGCLQCHGSQLSAEVQQGLKALYPEDQATDYTEGDLRGAVSVSISVPTAEAGSQS